MKRADGLADEMVKVLLEDAQGGLWVGSHVAPWGGLTILENGGARRFTLENGLPHTDIAALYEDRSGAVWVGTGFADQGGLARFVRRNGVWTIERVLHRSDGLPGERVRSIFEDRDGTLWLGSELDGLARFRDGHLLRVLTVKDGMPNNEAACMLQTPDGALWLGTPAGVVRINAETLAHIGM